MKLHLLHPDLSCEHGKGAVTLCGRWSVFIRYAVVVDEATCYHCLKAYRAREEAVRAGAA